MLNKIVDGIEVQCTPEEEAGGLLQVIFEDGVFYNQVTYQEIRERLGLK